MTLKEADLSYSQRMQFYFSDNVFKSFIDGNMQNRFIMNVDNAQSVRAELDKISSFKHKKIKYRFPKNVKYLDITTLVSDVFSEVNFEESAAVNSFNCHNLSLILAGFKKHQTYTTQDEFLFYMNNFCEEVSKPKQKTISFLDNSMLSHSLTTIKGNLIIQKGSQSMKKPYAINYKNVDGLRHFDCNSTRYKNITCETLNDIDKKVDKIESFYSKLAKDLKSSRKMSRVHDQLIKVKEQLEDYNSDKNDCNLKKQAIKHKIESLDSLHEDLENGNLYGAGSYGGISRV
jgi:hypothetical protein